MLENKLYLHLSTVAGVSTYVSNRIYPLVLPQPPYYPCIAYNRIGTSPTNGMGGYGVLEKVTIQLDIYATDYNVVKNISSALQTAMGNATMFKSLLVENMDFIEPEVEAFRVTQQYSIWNSE